MSVRKVGFKRVERLLNELPETTTKHLRQAQEDNANEVVRVAKVLVPASESGRANAAIKTTAVGNGQLMDFGPLSAILEGGTQERFHKKNGKSVGAGPALPFVNPSMRSTSKSRMARVRKALRDAVKEAKRNG